MRRKELVVLLGIGAGQRSWDLDPGWIDDRPNRQIGSRPRSTRATKDDFDRPVPELVGPVRPRQRRCPFGSQRARGLREHRPEDGGLWRQILVGMEGLGQHVLGPLDLSPDALFLRVAHAVHRSLEPAIEVATLRPVEVRGRNDVELGLEDLVDGAHRCNGGIGVER